MEALESCSEENWDMLCYISRLNYFRNRRPDWESHKTAAGLSFEALIEVESSC